MDQEPPSRRAQPSASKAAGKERRRPCRNFGGGVGARPGRAVSPGAGARARAGRWRPGSSECWRPAGVCLYSWRLEASFNPSLGYFSPGGHPARFAFLSLSEAGDGRKDLGVVVVKGKGAFSPQ